MGEAIGAFGLPPLLPGSLSEAESELRGGGRDTCTLSERNHMGHPQANVEEGGRRVNAKL